MSRRSLAIVFALGYPILVVLGVGLGRESLRLAGLTALLLAVLLPGLLRGRAAAWCVGALATISILVVARAGIVMLPLLLTPIVIPAAVAWTFGRTLAPGRIPLITQIVRLLHGDDESVDPAKFAYARSLTLVWTVLLAGLATTNAVLAALTSPGGLLELAGFRSPLPVSNATWALFTNLIGYAVVGGFFLAEYAYRQRRFPEQPYRDLPDFLRRTVAAASRLTVQSPAKPARPRETQESGIGPMNTLGPATHSASLRIRADHPSLPGHFPGRPIVPAVVILDGILRAAESQLAGNRRVARLVHSKFLHPLLPDEEASITTELKDDAIRFTVRVGDETIAIGTFGLAAGARS